jgi:hypothetical protein
MAWTAPMTAIPGDVFTAAQFNTHVRDNLNYLKTQTDTNASDISTGNTNITNLTNWTRRGTALVTFSNVDSFSTSVSFGFTFPGAPTVTNPNINASSSAEARWDARALNPTTTGFTLFVYSNASGATSSWSAVPVTWTAVYRP